MDGDGDGDYNEKNNTHTHTPFPCRCKGKPTIPSPRPNKSAGGYTYLSLRAMSIFDTLLYTRECIIEVLSTKVHLVQDFYKKF